MTSIVIAGFGGQGIQFAAKQLALAGMHNNKQVTWIPSYGAEMRGGASNCTVRISDTEIDSPVTPNPDIIIAFNLPAYLKFEKAVAKGGCLICDSSMFNEKSGRDDINKYYIPATQMANDHNLKGLANTIVLGFLIAVTKIFTFDELLDSIVQFIPESKKHLVELNKTALKLGFDYKE